MKILFFILTVVFFSPSARAETMLDTSASFQVASAKRMYKETGINFTASSAEVSSPYQGTHPDSSSSPAGKIEKHCVTGQYKSNGNCISIQDGTECNASFSKKVVGNQVYCVVPFVN